MRCGARRRRCRDNGLCIQAQCFDPLLRRCVECKYLRVPKPALGKGGRLASGSPGEETPATNAPTTPPAQDPGHHVSGGPVDQRSPRGPHHPSHVHSHLSLLPHPASTPSSPQLPFPSVPHSLSPSPPPAPAAGPSSLAPGTVLQPQESVGAGAGPEAVLPLPGLLFGAPVLLGLALALALALVALVSWRWQRQRRTASQEAPERGQDEPPDNVFVPSSGALEVSAPVWPLPREDPDNTPPGHSVPVPATELGSTELVTTKTTGPEQQ